MGATDLRYLDMAARHALRAFGDTSPNPLVGAVIVGVDPDTGQSRVLGIGHHRVYADLHAEREALASARRQGHDVRGATMYVTLEPCVHTGKQPPCVDAILEAGIGEVVIACPDPSELAGGGADKLGDAGVGVRFVDASARLAGLIGRAYVRTALDRRPVVIAKWAQSLDGRSATRSGESQWISGEASRRRAHAWRARLDAIMVGIGTVLADNPRLSARDVPRIRRRALPVVVDPNLELPADAALLGAGEVVVIASESAPDRDAELAALGASVLRLPADVSGHPDLRAALGELHARWSVTNVMVEGGARLHGAMFDADLIDLALVYVAPMVMGDPGAMSAVAGSPLNALADAARFRLGRVRRVRDDLELVYVRAHAPGVTPAHSPGDQNRSDA